MVRPPTLLAALAITVPLVGLDLLAADTSHASSSISFDHVPRWDEERDLWDQDLYLNLLLRWGERPDPFSGSVYWRGVKDVDGPGEEVNDPFPSVYDAYGDGWFGHLYHAYFNLRGSCGGYLARLGRQFIHEGTPFHFDGIRYDTSEGPKGLRASVFGGVPVHYFEESNVGDWLAGAGVEACPWRGGRLGLIYAHVEDDSRLAGLPVTSEADDMLILRARARLSEWGSALLRYTAVDARTRDVTFRTRAFFQRTDTALSITYYAQPQELAEFTTDVSPYHLVQGSSYPFSRIDLFVSKGLRTGDWRISLEGRAGARRLESSGDEGEYNRDYDLVRLGAAFEFREPCTLSLAAGSAWWWSSGGDVSAFDGEVRWEPSDRFSLGVGSTYSLYRYELSTLAEQRDVRETYVRLRWRSPEKNEIRLRYSWESESGERIHKARLGCTVRF